MRVSTSSLLLTGAEDQGPPLGEVCRHPVSEWPTAAGTWGSKGLAGGRALPRLLLLLK